MVCRVKVGKSGSGRNGGASDKEEVVATVAHSGDYKHNKHGMGNAPSGGR